MSRPLIALALVLSTAACASYDTVSRGWIGDTAEHLVAARGQPNTVLHHDDGSTTLEFLDVFHLAPLPAPPAPHVFAAPTPGPLTTGRPDWTSTAIMHGVDPMLVHGGVGSNPSQVAAWSAAQSDYSSQQLMAAQRDAARTAPSAAPPPNVPPPMAFGGNTARPCTTSFSVDAAGIVTAVKFVGPGCTWPVGKLLDAHYFPPPRAAPATAGVH